MTKQISKGKGQPANGLAVGRFISSFSKAYWRMRDGNRIQVAFMRTEHMFFCFRMLYDGMAETEGWGKVRPEGEGYQAGAILNKPVKVAKVMAGMANEVILCGDLQEEWLGQFKLMLQTLLERSNLRSTLDKGAVKLLNQAK